MPSQARLQSPAALSPGSAQLPLVLLLLVGGLLAVSVLLSKIAFGLAVPMLTYLALAMAGSGTLLLLTAPRGDRGGVSRGWLWGYSAIAGGLMALGSAAGYLTVHVVGAAYISLAIAFPPMITWALSLALRMERFNPMRGLGLLVALGGGAILASGKSLTAPQGIGLPLLAASAIPLILAVGNVFRTRFWPRGGDPRLLASLMLVCGGGLTLPVALWIEGPRAALAFGGGARAALLVIAVLTFAVQYLLLFRLQRIAGPVYLSQIGSVAAAFGVPAAVLLLGEPLPTGAAAALALIALGLTIFQTQRSRR